MRGTAVNAPHALYDRGVTNLDTCERHSEPRGLGHTPQVVPRRMSVPQFQEPRPHEGKERCRDGDELDALTGQSVEQRNEHLR